jgi:hypothetical protein
MLGNFRQAKEASEALRHARSLEDAMQEAVRRSHSLRKPQAAGQRLDPPAPQWPSFTGVSQFVGATSNGRVTVFVDPSLGQPGLQNAHDLLDDADRVVAANDALFGATGGPVRVIVFALDGHTDGTGGADHMGCDFTTGAEIEVCASFGDPARVSALFEAELSECAMGGNLCGASTGEALSRWCAAQVSNNALSDFVTAPAWAQNGMPNFVDRTDPTDRDANSTGCGMAFLSWLISQGHPLDAIAPAMVALGDSGTLAQLYANLSGDAASNAWRKFIAAVRAVSGGITSDDPFGGTPLATQLAHLDPRAVALAGKLFSQILANLAAGKPAHQIVGSVHAIMLADVPNLRGAASCSRVSRRLLPPDRVAA